MGRGFPACQSLLHAHDGRETGLASRRTDVIPTVRRLQGGGRDASEIKTCFSSSSPLDVIFLLASVYKQLPLGPFRVSYFRAYCGPRGVQFTNRGSNQPPAPEYRCRTGNLEAPHTFMRARAAHSSVQHGIRHALPPKRVPDFLIAAGNPRGKRAMWKNSNGHSRAAGSCQQFPRVELFLVPIHRSGERLIPECMEGRLGL